MKLFLIFASKYSESREMLSVFKKNGHEILYWVYTDMDGNAREEMKGTICHNHYAAWAGNPAEGVDINEFAPPGKDLIEKMYKVESLVLTMMNKKFDTRCVDDRRHVYYGMLQYWKGILDKYKPDAIIIPVVPHTVYNFILYELAKLAGIRTIMFEDTWVIDRLLAYEDWMEGSKKLHEAMAKNTGKNFSPSDLSNDLKEYYFKQTNPQVDSTPVYMDYWKNKYSLLNKFFARLKLTKESLLDGTIYRKVPQFIVKQFQINLKKEYEALQSNPDLSKKFVYVPLGFQPERTTSPQGDMFVDQILTVKILSFSLPKDWLIYVKEHPAQWWLRMGINYSSARYKGYYNRLASIPNVKLVPVNDNSYELIGKSQAVAVVTGTAGWEAVLRSKPTLIFGYPWYRDCPEVFRINDTKTCNAALNKIVGGYKVSQQNLVNFLKSFDEATDVAYIEGFIDKISKLTREESALKVASLMLFWLENKK
ncbi:hypothetical protein A2662_02645 [Candidatus Giovannonibacteria bacterium RIFCSPHIGHO2_01_FULL_45_33]|uniref:Capsule polysaccharide biosynthesis protein n=1 Tax=Candidatus Giovannonibacteria bacterium RIFCSPLOWO2_01_FULL_45_34 TaxID=1798351 RepID=A0A1F5WYI7_9BACT|nr:MAG: hypothetical protein A2662_02645 [Candidatus Giovannonibacteria bacterium RIFCSPHIGHO2_01_FULL_45_33]OGF70979.1 MAG: hypothetical protein A3C73_04105 [Candidatus Giovannonibacteria bacterium RIFCSPHIGHO2_02_FULL_44_11]OGF80698.1 MAG: hypothetical protein A2930_01870 [Candidatus Giovannonibacteria bacterium RIFCSPLOWO2_01_FULL_45_34]